MSLEKKERKLHATPRRGKEEGVHKARVSIRDKKKEDV